MSAIGFLGVGHLAAAMIEGMIRAGRPVGSIVLSPRGQAEALHRRHGALLAADNRDLVARCDVVILATRPKDAATAVADLGWREGQVLVSACAGVALDRLVPHAAPATVCRIMPLTASAFGTSPTTLFPLLPEAQALLGPLGPVIPLLREADFEVATVSAAVYGWAQALIARSADWQVAEGLDPALARRLCALTFAAAGTTVAESETPMEILIEELATPGGITERGLDVLRRGDAMATWDEAAMAVLRKLRGLDD